ncbi:hypothetical protein AAHC03_05174 [Spirometra sp. Aus1]|nr:unnamed protein product [Spirometra erinaceieuropaei]
MPYVAGGRLVENEPWSLSYVARTIGGLFDVVLLFFSTLLPLNLIASRGGRQPQGNRSNSNQSNIRRGGNRPAAPAPPPCFGGG